MPSLLNRAVFARKSIVIGLVLLVLNGCGAHVHHKVKHGESLYAIGWRYDQDYRDIARWNNLPSPYVIKPGQWLRVAPPKQPWWVEQYPDQYKDSSPAKTVIANNKSVDTVVIEPKIKPSMPTETEGVNFVTPPTTGETVNNWLWPTDRSLPAQKTQNSQYKKGVIFAGVAGKPVYASASGEVVYRGSGLLGYGKLIIIKHNKTYLSAYANNEKMLVGEGDRVKIGQQIATMGQTPEGEVLLYFEIRKNGKPVDPVRYLKAPAAR